jgi:hypothetical protein
MNDFNDIHRLKKKDPNFESRSDNSRPKGLLVEEIYKNYYDMSNVITTTQSTDPNDPDHPNYNREPVFESLERTAPFLWVTNDNAAGGAILYVIASHQGGQHFTRERPIYPGQFKIYKNIYELRLRSGGQSGTAYRVSEYELGVL